MEFLARIASLVGAHPQVAAIVAVGLIVTLLIWGVVSSSYRYR
jgi:hypothetical protein